MISVPPRIGDRVYHCPSDMEGEVTSLNGIQTDDQHFLVRWDDGMTTAEATNDPDIKAVTIQVPVRLYAIV